MKSITFATSLAAIANAVNIVYREDIPAKEFRPNREDFAFAFPWPADNPFCGGAMVTPQHMITAAHCIGDGFENGFVPFEIEHKGNRYKVVENRTLDCYDKFGKSDEPGNEYDHKFPSDIAILVLENPIPGAVAGDDYIDVWDVKKQNQTFEG